MTAIGFDTLSASKRLREAGMNERMADTVVEIFQQTASMPDISHLATKDDLKQFATKEDLKTAGTRHTSRYPGNQADFASRDGAAGGAP